MRLQGLKKMFMKDEKFFKEISWKTEKSPNASHVNNWYILHHEVYHAAKPGKLMVVFDCSANYLGYALDKQLIPRSDLTNQIVGVLKRFREEQVAFMDDIEAMFYQVWIP